MRAPLRYRKEGKQPRDAGTPVRARAPSAHAVRPWLRDAGILAALFMVGFSIAFVYVSPGPLLTSDHATADVIGMPSDRAEERLEAEGFKVKRAESRQHPTYDQGAVISQDPPAGTVMPQSSVVTLTVSDGIAEYPVPDVLQLPLEYAGRVIAAGGFRLGRVDTVETSGPAGRVVEVRPSSGTLQSLGTPVQLVVSVPRSRLPSEVVGPGPGTP
jgi:serine/threonine-protein kinase